LGWAGGRAESGRRGAEIVSIYDGVALLVRVGFFHRWGEAGGGIALREELVEGVGRGLGRAGDEQFIRSVVLGMYCYILFL
jgi:hypothetical protein